jgi:hypothetical protein
MVEFAESCRLSERCNLQKAAGYRRGAICRKLQVIGEVQFAESCRLSERCNLQKAAGYRRGAICRKLQVIGEVQFAPVYQW